MVINVTPEELVRRHPLLYHMAEAGSWPSIQEHGLLSTTALLDLFEVDVTDRCRMESEWRQKSISIRHPSHGIAVIRDQRPMPPSKLASNLVDMSPQQWYEFLNRKTFFWADWNRLSNLLNAYAYRNRAHSVLFVDTEALLTRHGHRTSLCAINSGFVYHGGKRGRETFKEIGSFPSGSRVWELAVEYSVPDIVDLVVRVEDWQRDSKLRLVWDRKRNTDASGQIG